jgi:hypothetical protein
MMVHLNNRGREIVGGDGFRSWEFAAEASVASTLEFMVPKSQN